MLTGGDGSMLFWLFRQCRDGGVEGAGEAAVVGGEAAKFGVGLRGDVEGGEAHAAFFRGDRRASAGVVGGAFRRAGAFGHGSFAFLMSRVANAFATLAGSPA